MEHVKDVVEVAPPALTETWAIPTPSQTRRPWASTVATADVLLVHSAVEVIFDVLPFV
jgi:hypothetical protein